MKTDIIEDNWKKGFFCGAFASLFLTILVRFASACMSEEPQTSQTREAVNQSFEKVDESVWRTYRRLTAPINETNAGFRIKAYYKITDKGAVEVTKEEFMDARFWQ